MSTNKESVLFDPQVVSLCVRDAEGTVHALRPDAPDVEPWVVCGREAKPGVRFVLRFGPMLFAGLNGARLESPERCPICMPPSDEERARTLVGRLRLFASMAGEEDRAQIRRRLDGEGEEAPDGRFAAVVAEALERLRDFVEAGDLSREDYDSVVEELCGEPNPGEGSDPPSHISGS